MAMRGFVAVPKSGLSIHGVTWPEGPREITDAGWFQMLKEAGAEVITEREFEDWQKIPKGYPAQSAEEKLLKKPNNKKGKK